MALFAPASNAQIDDPTEIADLVVWLDARDVFGTGTDPVNGASVSSWADKSGNGNDLSTAGGTITYEQTGFNGENPGLRFPSGSRMAGPNPFPGATDNEATIFFVNMNVTLTRNFSVSLHGTNTGSSGANARYSFHAPWFTEEVFFDAGGCCGATRLRGTPLTAFTETTIYTGVNDMPGNQQLLRVDGVAFREDDTGHNANVSGGIHLGSIAGNRPFNGRFAEVIIYDRALTLSEIADVECYLLNRWKPASALPLCPFNVTTTKAVEVWDPLSQGLYFVPGNDAVYTLTVNHMTGAQFDLDSVFLVDTLPSEVEFYNDDMDDGGPETDPVAFTDNGSGLTFNFANDIRFSNQTAVPTSFSSCNYTPSSGYDEDVLHICLNPKGRLGSAEVGGSASFSFRTRIK